MKQNYFIQEQNCSILFESLGEVYHICTPEDAPLFFVTQDDYKTANSLLGLAIMYFPNIHLIAYEIMSNHFHFVIQGSRQDIIDFLNLLRDLLARTSDHFLNHAVIKNMDFKFSKIESLKYLRNVIAYVHRNASLVNPDTTPFTFKWGSNLCYFNEEYNVLVRKNCKPSFQSWRRAVSHRKIFDELMGAVLLDDTLSPLCFCDIKTGEAVFRDARNYCQTMNKSVEAFAEISKLCGEKVALLDSELYIVAQNIAKNDFGKDELLLLDSDSRIAIAKELKWNYLANNKQIHRILRLDFPVLESIFGT